MSKKNPTKENMIALKHSNIIILIKFVVVPVMHSYSEKKKHLLGISYKLTENGHLKFVR